MGVGKTTLLDACVRQRAAGASWITAWEADQRIVQAELRKKPLLKRVALATLLRSGIDAESLRLRLLEHAGMSRCAWDEAPTWQGLVDEYLVSTADYRASGMLKLKRVERLLSLLQRLALYRRMLDDMTLVLDEGLLMRMRAARLIEAAPALVPAAVIYVHANADLVVSRMLARHEAGEWRDALHARSREEAAALARQNTAWRARDAADLETRGVPILRVDAGNPLVENAGAVNAWLAALAADEPDVAGALAAGE
jgi:hypothetical protein